MGDIGHILQQPISNDLDTLGQSYKDLEGLTKIDLNSWISYRNTALTSFLQGIAGTVNSTRKEYCIAKAIEGIYYLRNPSHVILPLGFSENVVSYSVTNSKIATNINGVGGSGGYESVRQWLNAQADVPQPEVEGDVAVAFDNDQVIGKSYHSRTENKAKMSIITAVSLADVDKKGVLQEREDLVPRIWDHLTKLPDVVKNETSSFYTQVKQPKQRPYIVA
ncbi:uncharacterized protein [Amphiura filiformis]|uniref:uncharacterized protein n=1 Tax=Amphiura filiformis TaxID=82378 RepID=UPI003B20F28A